METIMAQTFETYVSDGTQTIYTFSFDYLKKSFVKVRVDGVDVGFTLSGTYQVALDSAPAADSVIVIRRVTDTERLVTFVDGSVLVAKDLNVSALQATHIAAEALDVASGSLLIDEAGNYSAGFRRLGDLGDPVDPRDAVNREWAETAMSSQLTQAESAASSANTSATSAANSASAANADAYGSKTYSLNAATSETNAASSANSAATSATDAASSASAAATSETNAGASANAAATSASNAASSEAGAAANADAASTSAGNAGTSETNAAAWARSARRSASSANASAGSASTSASNAAASANAAATSESNAASSEANAADSAAAAATFDPADFLPKTGGTLSGALTVQHGWTAQVYVATGANLAGAALRSNNTHLVQVVPVDSGTFKWGESLRFDSSGNRWFIGASHTAGREVQTQDMADVRYAKLTGAQTLTGGFKSTSHAIGVISSGTVTLNPSNGNLQRMTNGGAFTLAAPSSETSMVLLLKNGAAAGAVTFSGFDKVGGDELTTTNGDNFMVHVTVIENTQVAFVEALQ